MGTPEIEESATLVTNEPTAQDNSASSTEPTVNWEKRFKDTQAAYTKSRQELAEVKAKLTVLEEMATPRPSIDAKLQEELDDLKYSDPDAWRRRINGLEAEASQAHKEKLAQASKHVTELERRAIVFDEFKESHPDVHIDDDVIKFDVPPRITKKLEEGKISFSEFLEEVYNYLKSPKVIGDGNKILAQPNLSKEAGDNTPTKTASEKDSVSKYKKEIF